MAMSTMRYLARIDRLTWLLIATLAVLGLYLLVENSTVIVNGLVVAAPWLLLAACPLIHVFMHRSHGRRDDAGDDDKKDDSDR